MHKERIANSLANNLPFLAFLSLIILFLFISLAIPFWGVDYSSIDQTSTIDPSIANGILTATALVFGILIWEAREIETEPIAIFCIVGIPVIFLLFGVHGYFIDAISVGKPTVRTVAWLTSVLFFMILYQIALLLLKELEKRKS